MGNVRIDRGSRIVIIGAGVVGAALADDLTRVHRMQSVTVVDQGPLFQTGGSSSHAPGFAFQTTGQSVMSELAKRTVDKLEGTTLDGKWVMKRVGGLELASSAERMEYLHRRHEYAEAWGIPSEIVGPERCAELFPGLDPESIIGGFHTPTDAAVKSVRAVEVQGRRAIENGATFYGLTQVTELIQEGGRVRGVRVRPVPPVPGNPSAGTPLPPGTETIPADYVFVCTGLWGPSFGKSIGVELPMVPVEHCESWTSALPGQQGLSDEEEIERPLLRHQESGLYLRQYGSGYIWGTYEHRVIPMTQQDISDPEAFAETGIHPAIHELTPEDLDDTWAQVNRLLPATRELDRVDGMNGIFSFTPDGNPLIGKVPHIEGLWLGLSVWLTQSAGVAGVLADWLVKGDPGIDTTSLDYKRFDQAGLTRTASLAWASESRAESYRIAHPRKYSAALRGRSTSPFYLRQQASGAVFGQVGGWEKPLWYGDSKTSVTGRVTGGYGAFGVSSRTSEEIVQARRSAVLVDRSALSLFEVRGGDLPAALGWDSPFDVGEVRRARPLNNAGTIVGEYAAIGLGGDRVLIIGGSTQDRWRLQDLAPAADLTDVSAAYSALSLTGPGSDEVLAELLVSEPDAVSGRFDLAGVPVHVVAEDRGMLLIFAPQYGLYVWDQLTDRGVTPIGSAAAAALEILNGTPVFGVDYDSADTPDTAGLTGNVLSDGSRRLVRIRIEASAGALTSGEPISQNGVVVGYVTSAASDPLGNAVLAFARLDPSSAEIGTALEVAALGNSFAAAVELVSF